MLIGTGVYLMTDRSNTRILVGVVRAGNGVNLMFLVASEVSTGDILVGKVTTRWTMPNLMRLAGRFVRRIHGWARRSSTAPSGTASTTSL